MSELIGSTFILAGAVFLFSAGLGLLRMPDAYTRIQAGTKASTLGNMLVLIGLAFYHPSWTFRLILVVYFVLVTNPVSSHALSRAAWLIRTPMTSSTITDALAEDERNAGEKKA
jgi:multicomponent Na+:H+ antiporter subunit G